MSLTSFHLMTLYGARGTERLIREVTD